MAATPSPQFGINGGAVGVKASIVAGASFSATLNDISGVSPVLWWVNSVDDSGLIASYPITTSGSVGQTATLTAGAAGTAGELRVRVAGGISPATGSPSTTMEYSTKWYVPTVEGLEVLTAGEFEDGNRLGSATHGAVAAVNAMIRSGISLGDWKPSVKAATTAALPAHTRTGSVLTASANGALPAQDAVTLVANDLLLVKNEAASHLEHGVYTLTQVGTGSTPWILTRTTWMDASTELTDMTLVPVEQGTAASDTVWALTTNNPITINVTAIAFANFAQLVALVNASVRGAVNPLGAANAVLTTDGATAGGAWAKILNVNVDALAAITGDKISQVSNTTQGVASPITGATLGLVSNAAGVASVWQPVATAGLDLAIATPTWSQNAKASDVAPTNLLIAPQAPFGTATGANRIPGALRVNIAAPTNGGTTEGFFEVQRAGITRLQLGHIASAPFTGGVASLLTAPTDQDIAIAGVGTGRIILSGGNGGTQPVAIRCSALYVQDPNGAGLQFTPDPTASKIEFVAGNTAAKIFQAQVSAGAGSPLAIAAQASAAASAARGGDLQLKGGAGDGAAASGDLALTGRAKHQTVTQAMADVNQTLSGTNSGSDVVITTGVNSVVRTLTMGTPQAGLVFFVDNRCTGAGTTFKCSTGTGITVALLRAAILYCDGTNVLRLTPDTDPLA